MAEGRTALVTGAGNGLGQAVAHELPRRGTRVILTAAGLAAAGVAARRLQISSPES